MSDSTELKAKLGLDVFKPVEDPHIRIRVGMEKDPRLKPAIRLCPASLYSENERGEMILDTDGCLECGACRLACGADVLDWHYPKGGTGVQYRFG